jgi:hypothetical protein
MELEELLLRKKKLKELSLKKEELPILDKNCFQIPIHPKLLDSKIQINKLLARQIFPRVAEDWYEDLRDYITEDNQEKEWIDDAFLKKGIKLTRQHTHQILNDIWQDNILFADNGLVTYFSINKNAGGSLYFNKSDFIQGLLYNDPHETPIPNKYILFSPEKTEKFRYKKSEGNSNSIALTYLPRNIKDFPEALFLRAWTIKYINEALEQVI